MDLPPNSMKLLDELRMCGIVLNKIEKVLNIETKYRMLMVFFRKLRQVHRTLVHVKKESKFDTEVQYTYLFELFDKYDDLYNRFIYKLQKCEDKPIHVEINIQVKLKNKHRVW
ncbi:MAG: hypothetical protein RLY43_777 [Bacteroidota bacterium]|jgi:hypothetical protein